ncbi:MAG: LytR C-terminal domain-containing protein [Bacteroidota bacterium]
MKKFISSALLIFLFFGFSTVKAQNLSPYIKVGVSGSDISQTSSQIKSALQAKGFEIIGEYNPENKSSLKVIVYTRKDLQTTVLKVKDRGALAAALKVGLISKSGKTTISYLNPEYLFNAYLGKNYASHQTALKKVTADAKSALSTLGSENKPFGGSLSASKLQKYQYKMMMPYFTDPVELEDFDSFEEGVKIIEKNLAAKKGNTKLIYKLKFSSSKVAVFGVGLMDKTKGEAKFLPIIGEDHIAAMPYEIILQGTEATMLHGRYRLAVHWPELTMGTFMEIMSSPGDIEETLEGLCE